MKIGQYQFCDNCAGLLALLNRTRLEDKRAERNSTAGCSLSFFFAFAAIATLVFGMGLLCLAMTAGFVAALFLGTRASQHDLEDRKYQVPARFLEVAQADIPPASQVKMEIDFRPHHEKEFQTKPGAFAQAWLDLRGRLADGGSFRIGVTADVKRKEKAKRKRTKVTERVQESVTLRLALDPQRYPAAGAVVERLQSLSAPDRLSVRGLRALPDGSLQAVLTRPLETRVNGAGTGDGQVTGDTLLAILVWAYRGAKAAKASPVRA